MFCLFDHCSQIETDKFSFLKLCQILNLLLFFTSKSSIFKLKIAVDSTKKNNERQLIPLSL